MSGIADETDFGIMPGWKTEDVKDILFDVY